MRTRRLRWRVVYVLLTALACVGCGQMTSSSSVAGSGTRPGVNVGPRPASNDAHTGPRPVRNDAHIGRRPSVSDTAIATVATVATVATAQLVCRWYVKSSADQTHTAPGSYVERPPGACPETQLTAAVGIAQGLRAGGGHGVGVCRLLAPVALANAERVAGTAHVPCGAAALQPAVNGSYPPGQRFSHLAHVLLLSSSPGAPRWAGFLVFARADATKHPDDTRDVPLNVEIEPSSSGHWAIVQIGYQF